MSDTLESVLTTLKVDTYDGHWRARAVAALLPLGEAAIGPAAEVALAAVAAARAGGASPYPWHLPMMLDFALMRLELGAGRPLSARSREALLRDLSGADPADLGETAAALEGLSPAEREEFFAKAFERGGEPLRAMQLGHRVPNSLPRVLAFGEKLTAGKNDGHKITALVAVLTAYGHGATAAMRAALPGAPGPLAEAIVRALEATADPAAADALVDALGHAAKPARMGAAAALRKLGDAARPAIERGAASKKKPVREASVELLSALSAERTPADAVFDALAAAPAEQRAAIDAHYAKGETTAVQADPKLVDAHGALLLAAGADRVKAAPDNYNLSYTFAGVAHELSRRPESAEAAAWVLVRAVASLPKMIPHKLRGFLQAVRAFGARAAPALTAALKGPAFPARTALFEVLCEVDPAPDRALLAACVGDESKEVRALASDALAKQGADAAPLVLPHLEAKSYEVRSAAAALLATLAAPAAREALETALAKEKRAEVAAVMERALAASGGATGAAAPGGTVAATAGGDDDAASLVAALGAERKAKLPAFVDAASLPPLRLKSGAAIEGDALRGFLSRLTNEGPEGEDPGARRMRPHLDDASAAVFAVALKDAWVKAGSDSKHKWAVYQQAILADEARLDEFAPRLDEAASAGQHHQAGWYLDVLARHGTASPSATNVGLSWVSHWVKSAETRAVRTRAREALDKAAAARGVTVGALVATLNGFIAEDVADRRIDALGFDGAVPPLDYGARSFRVQLGADLSLSVVDADGERRDALPAPRKDDDAALARAAKTQFAALKKRLGAAVTHESRRLERAMVEGRPWRRAVFEKLFFQHPIMSRLLEPLVWRSGGVIFRVAEKTYVDPDYAPVTLSADAVIELVHRLDLGAPEVARWAQHFADAKLVPPFAQMARETYGGAGPLVPEGRVPPATLAGRIRASGWRNAAAEDAGMVYAATRTFAGRGTRARISHGGFHVSDVGWSADPVGVDSVAFTDLADAQLDAARADPIVVSEVWRDVRNMVAR